MKLYVAAFAMLALAAGMAAQEHSRDHPAPEKLGHVAFPTTCAPAVQAKFERAVALLHSFAYGPAESAFAEVARCDRVGAGPPGEHGPRARLHQRRGDHVCGHAERAL